MTSRRPIHLKIASPCTADWDRMTGDEAVRFCGQCNKNVYQLSAMTTEQVETLLAGDGEPPCVRFYQRKDGTVLTGDCPVGARRVRRKRVALALGAGALSAVGLALFPGAAAAPAPAAPTTSAAIEPAPAPDVEQDWPMGVAEVVTMGEAVVAEPDRDEPAPRPRMGRAMIHR